MVEHSSAPWEVGPPADSDQQGRSLWIEDGDGRLVAVVYGDKEYPDRLRADARLIAAAPDLLDACEAIVNRLDYLSGLWGQEGVTRSLQDQVKAAIRKAKEGTDG